MEDTDEMLSRVAARAKVLEESGLDCHHAFGRAWLEDSIERRWPSAWGKNLHVLIYGDFRAPDKDLAFEPLGIVIHHQSLKDTIIKSALCVLEATISVEQQSVDAVLDAVRRLNILLGAWTLTTWANTACGWWCSLTHPSMSTIAEPLNGDELSTIVPHVIALPSEARKRAEAALFWMRTPHRLLHTAYDIHTFRTYSNYWNAFECLVDAICVLRPREDVGRAEKQAQVDRFLVERGGKITSGDIDTLYRTVVNPGFVGKAKHALSVCFEVHARAYIVECFERSDEANRLYSIRNAINHGSVSAEDPNERLRIEGRLSMLTIMLLQMFARLVPYSAPSVEGFVRHASGLAAIK